jgi:hypothetical protein
MSESSHKQNDPGRAANGPGARRAATAVLMGALAPLADLPLSEERLSALEDRFDTMLGEHADLRALPLELSPHLVFDPRWD